MEKGKSKEEKLKDLKRQQVQKRRSVKVRALKVKEGKKQMLKPGSEHMVGAATADVLVKAGRAEIVK